MLDSPACAWLNDDLRVKLPNTLEEEGSGEGHGDVT